MTAHPRDRYVSVLLRDESGDPLPGGVVWVEWSAASGQRHTGPLAGPVVLPLDPIDAMSTIRVESMLASAHYRIAGPWTQSPRGLVAWVEPATSWSTRIAERLRSSRAGRSRTSATRGEQDSPARTTRRGVAFDQATPRRGRSFVLPGAGP